MHMYVPVKRSLKETLLDILQTEDTYIDMDIQDYCEEEKKKINVTFFCPLFLKFHPFIPCI